MIDSGRIEGLKLQPSGGSWADIVDYKFNGTNRLVKIDDLQPDIRREMFNSTTNSDYDAWDRFGRTVRQQWDDYTSGTITRDQFKHYYDYAGNCINRELMSLANDEFDQGYTYDDLHRLKTFAEGELNSSSSPVIKGTPESEQDWTLDQLGNWTNFIEKTNGTTDLDQDRAHNDANEIDDGTDNGITTTTGTNWADPVHDAAGNMTTIPQPQTLSSSYTLKYDAWNRLVEVKDDSTVVQANEYDGLSRRIIRDETGGSGDKIHFYYSQQWQVLEERKEVSGTEDPDPLAQYLYHPDYVDAIAVRYYDADTDGAGIVEHYYLQDANFNVTAVTDDAGAVKERYAYTPYGEVSYLDASFVALSTQESDIDNELLYTGRRLDPETGLQLNRLRFYISLLGRWTNRDSIGFQDGPNLYQYVKSRPLDYLDPAGDLSVCCRRVRGNPFERIFKHCEIRNGPCPPDTPEDDWSENPIWRDKDANRNTDNGIPCSAATKADIEACFKRNKACAGAHVGSNCQSCVGRGIGNCCMRSDWNPNFYAFPGGGDRGNCTKWKYVTSPTLPTIKVCVEWELPRWRYLRPGEPVPDPDPPHYGPPNWP